jgi:hypothetical protein
VPEELTEPHAGEGDIRQIGAGAQALNTADWVRLVLLLVLGLMAQGLRRWFIASAFGSVVALLIHGIMEWSWVWSFEAGLAAAYTLPLLVSILWENFRITLAFAVLLGGPTFFVSRFLFDSSWIFAAADTVAFMHLAPMAIIRVLVAMGIIELPTKTKGLPPHWPLKEQESVYTAGAPDRASSSPLEDRSYRTSRAPLRFPRNTFP